MRKEKMEIPSTGFPHNKMPMAVIVQQYDWTKTPLGAIHSWPEVLQTSVNICLYSKFANAVLWGEEMIQIYNDGYRDILGIKCDGALGARAEEAWREIGSEIGPMLKSVLKEGKPILLENQLFVLNRKGNSEECYFTFSYSPIYNSLKKIEGLFVSVVETSHTQKRIEETEIRQKLAIEAAAIGTFEWDIPKSTFLYSKRLAEIFGYSDTRDLVQKSFGDRIHPEDQPIRIKAHQTAFETGTLLYEARIVWPDNSIHWVRLNGKVVYDEDGKPARMYGTTLDISGERTQFEKLEKLVEKRTSILAERNAELQRSEERYHKMVEEVQDYAIILLDKDGFIQNWNKGAEKIKFYKESEILGKHFRIFYLPEDQANKLPERLIREASDNGRATHEGWRLRKDGSKFWGSIAITALHDDQNDIIGFSKVTRDLTERKAAEDKMLAYTTELESQNKELEQFAYVASHDLQEPLRKIRTFTEVIQKNIHNETIVKNYFDKVNSSARRMSELIQSVLNYSKLSKSNEAIEDADLNSILEHVKADFELLIEEKGAKIIVENLPKVKGVVLQLSQLFANLISNALKFSVQNPVIKISSRVVSKDQIINTVNYLADADYLEISFSDNGIGFDQKYEKQIFTMFQRLHGRHHYAGTGIGLALCKKIVENHDGYITAKGELGKGSTFYVYLPISH